MKIGQAIQAINRSESEGLRIIGSIVDGVGKPSEIYSKYSKKEQNKNFWNNAQKKLKITGFRPEKSKNIILSRIFQGIKSNNHACINLFWSLYANCVIAFVNNEHANLNQLLLDKEMEGDAESTYDILKAIVKFIPLYEVGTEQIEELYEAWWFERTESLCNIFSSQEISLDVVKEMVVISEQRQAQKLDRINKSIINLESRLEDFGESVQHEKEISNLEEMCKSLREDIAIDLAEIDKKIFILVEDKIAELEDKLDAKHVSDVSDVSNRHDDILEKKISSNAEKINAINERIEKLVKEKKRKEEERLKGRLTFNDYASISRNLSKVFDNSRCADKNSELIQAVFNSFGGFYIESEVLFRALSQKLILDGKVKEIVATPAMIDSTLLNIDSLEDFDIVFIKNISSCFIEGVVIPLLIRANSLINKNFPKVFVLHDDELNSSITSKIKTYTLDISSVWLGELKNLTILDSAKITSLRDIEEISNNHRQLLQLLNNSSVFIDHQNFERFVRLSHLLSCCVDSRQSMALSAQGAIYPYIRSAYGDSKAEVVIEILNGIV